MAIYRWNIKVSWIWVGSWILPIIQPSNPVRWQLWYDIENNKMYIYNWENWLEFATPKEPTVYRYMTLTIDESVSNPANMITYTSQDAIDCTDWDKFFWVYPVLLDNSWNEYKKLNPNNFQQFEDWSDASSYTASANYDVMIAFPRMWYKSSKSWDTITISITDDPHAESDWYKYYAHQRLNYSSQSATPDLLANCDVVDKDIFYVWAYKAFLSWTTLRSWYNQTPTVNNKIYYFTQYAHNHWIGWDQIWVAQKYLQEIYSLFKYKTTNLQSALWRWYVDASWSSYPGPNTWVDTYNKGMNYWTTSWTVPVKFLWMEHFYGWIWEWINGLNWNSNSVWNFSIPNLNWSNRYASTSSTDSSYYYEPKWRRNLNWWSALSLTNWAYITKMSWETEWVFLPINNSWGSETTYFTDYARWASDSRVAKFGGMWINASKCGAFFWVLNNAASNSDANIGSRLMFL